MAPGLAPLLWPILGGLLGLVIGSFLATLVLRWPDGRGLGGRSACDGCGAALGLRELVPLLSFAVQRGRCRRCGSAIDWRHPAIEACAMAVGAAALAAVPGAAGLAGALLGWILLALLVLDAEHFWLPDALTLPLLALGLALGAGTLTDRLLGAALGGSAMLAVALGYRAIRGRDGLGLGDVKLVAALGAWLSPASLAPLILLAALVGLGLSGWGLIRGRAITAGTRVPLGSCLAAAGFALWLATAGGGV